MPRLPEIERGFGEKVKSGSFGQQEHGATARRLAPRPGQRDRLIPCSTSA